MIKKKRYSAFTEPKRKNWVLIWSIVIVFLIIIACFIYGIFLYSDLYESKTKGFDETNEQILNQTAITEIDKIEKFNGAKSYHVIYGKNENEEEKIIFYPLEGNEKNLTTVDASETISQEQILQLWNEECESCDFVAISPAIIDDEVLWEIAYKDDQNRYVLDFFSMYDASRYEQHRFNPMFN